MNRNCSNQRNATLKWNKPASSSWQSDASIAGLLSNHQFLCQLTELFRVASLWIIIKFGTSSEFDKLAEESQSLAKALSMS